MDRTGRTSRLVRAARRRMTAAAVLDASGRALAWGALASVLSVGASRLVPIPLHWAWLAAAPLGVAAGVGLAVGLARRRSILSAAGAVDQRLRLKDRLSTATAFGATANGEADAFVSLALEDAEAASAKVDPRRAVPVLLGRSWQVWPTLAVGAVALGMFAPSTDLWTSKAKTLAHDEAKRREAVRMQIDAAAREVQKPQEETLVRPPDSRRDEQAKVLEDIQRELTSGKASPQQAAEQAARQLDHLAAERENQAEKSRREQESVQEALAKLAKSSGEGDGGGQSPLAKALRSGDLASAAQAARDLIGAKADQTPEERARAAQELEQIARDMASAERAKQDAQAAPADRTSDESSAASKMPPSQPDADQAGSKPSPSSAERRADSGADEGPKDQRHKPNPVESLTNLVKRAAEALKRPPPRPPDTEQPKEQGAAESPQPNPEKPAGTPGTERQGAEKPQTSTNERPASAQGQARETKPQDARQQSSGERQKQGGASPDSNPAGEAKSDGQRGQSPDGKPSAAQSDKPTPDGQPKPAEQPGQSSSPKPNDQASPKPGDVKPDGSQPGPQQSDGEKPGTASEKPGSTTPSNQGESRPSQGTESDAKQGEKSDKSAAGEKPGTGDRTQPSPGDSQGAKPQSQTGSGEQGGQQREPRPTPGASAGQTKPAPGDAASNPDNTSKRGTSDHPKPQGVPADKGETKPGGAAGRQGNQGDTPKVDGASKPIPGAQDQPGAMKPVAQPDGSKPGLGEDQRAKHSADGEKQSDRPTAAGDKQSPGETGKQPENQPGGLPQRPPSADDIRRLAEQLEKLSKSPQDAAARDREAQELRRQAEEILRKATPEQREQARRWAQDVAKQLMNRKPPASDHSSATDGQQPPQDGIPGGGPSGPAGENNSRAPVAKPPARTETMDARPPTPAERSAQSHERVIAEWYTDRKAQPGDGAPAQFSPESEQAIQRAVRGGERAVEEQSVPERFDKLLLRYFQRLPDRAKSQTPAAAPAPKAAEPAKDAP